MLQNDKIDQVDVMVNGILKNEKAYRALRFDSHDSHCSYPIFYEKLSESLMDIVTVTRFMKVGDKILVSHVAENIEACNLKENIEACNLNYGEIVNKFVGILNDVPNLSNDISLRYAKHTNLHESEAFIQKIERALLESGFHHKAGL